MARCIMCDIEGFDVNSDKICEGCMNHIIKERRNISGKPPLGIEPHKFWVETRIKEILDAINRYIQADMKIPIKWIEEYNELIKNDECKTANEMFEELGYKLVSNNGEIIYYEDDIKEYIKFGIKTKLFHASRSVNQKEYIAIQKQISELGWK